MLNHVKMSIKHDMVELFRF